MRWSWEKEKREIDKKSQSHWGAWSGSVNQARDHHNSGDADANPGKDPNLSNKKCLNKNDINRKHEQWMEWSKPILQSGVIRMIFQFL